MEKNKTSIIDFSKISSKIDAVIDNLPIRQYRWERRYKKKRYQIFEKNIDEIVKEIHSGVTELCNIYDFNPQEYDFTYVKDQDGCWIKSKIEKEKKEQNKEKQIEQKPVIPVNPEDSIIVQNTKKLEYYSKFNAALDTEFHLFEIVHMLMQTQSIISEKGIIHFDNEGELEFRTEKMAEMIGKYIKIMKYPDFVDEKHKEILTTNLKKYSENTMQFIKEINRNLIISDIEELNTDLRAGLISEDNELQYYHEGGLK